MVNLIEIVGDWINSLNTDFSCVGNRIVGPCICGKKLRVGLIKDDYVALTETKCKCENCAQIEVPAGDPQFFEMLKTCLQSRLDHESTIVSPDVVPGDDIQHVIDHASNGVVIRLGAGIYYNESVDLKDAKIHITGLATFNSCAFNNISKPISSDFNANFTSCSFVASEKQPIQTALEIPGGSVIGSLFDGAGISWITPGLPGIYNVQF